MTDRFGIEMEFACPKENTGQNLEYVADLIRSHGMAAESSGWGYSTGNSSWVCKPDSSCGIEICSPVLDRGDVSSIKKVLELISPESSLSVDQNCSVHLHVDVMDPPGEELCSILGWWIKFEHIFLDFAVSCRKTNRYCKFIGETPLFDHEEKVSVHRMFSKLSEKYLTLNTFHMFNRRRNSVEFRILEGTKNFGVIENWIDLVFCFLDACRKHTPPETYSWSDPEDLFSFMDLRAGLGEWFLDRLISNCFSGTSGSRRSDAFAQYLNIKARGNFGQKPYFLGADFDK